MNKYQSYKSSGVEWIGEIPDGWIIGRLGYFSNVYRGSGYQYLNQVDDDFEKRKERVVRIGDISDFNPIWCEYVEQFENYRIKKDEILVGGTGHYFGKSIYVTDEMEGLIHSYNIIRLVIKNQYSKYVQYYLSSPMIREQMDMSVLGSGQPFIDLQGLKDLIILIPEYKEQLQIVQFLDEKTELIDKLISTKERKITLLKEQRTSLINQVVTKGLNPNVKMKDSGVEWIGEIPEHWVCVGTNKVYQDLGSGTTPTSDNKDYYSEDGFHWITTTDLNEGIMYDTLTKISNKSIIDYPNLRLYPSGSIYISMYGGRIGKLGVSTFDSYCNQSVCVLPKNDKINVKFYYYWFLGFQELIKNMGRGGGQPNINKEMIKQFPTVKLDLIEQNQLVEHLDSKTKEIDDLVELEQKKIDLLKEYRQSLISEVVTGKIKVTTDE